MAEVVDLPATYTVDDSRPGGLPHEYQELGINLKQWACCARKGPGVKGCTFANDDPPSEENPIGGCVFRKQQYKTGPLFVGVGKTSRNGKKTVRVVACSDYMAYYKIRHEAGYRIIAGEGETFTVDEQVPAEPGNAQNKRMTFRKTTYRVPKFPRPNVAMLEVASAAAQLYEDESSLHELERQDEPAKPQGRSVPPKSA